MVNLRCVLSAAGGLWGFSVTNVSGASAGKRCSTQQAPVRGASRPYNALAGPCDCYWSDNYAQLLRQCLQCRHGKRGCHVFFACVGSSNLAGTTAGHLQAGYHMYCPCAGCIMHCHSTPPTAATQSRIPTASQQSLQVAAGDLKILYGYDTVQLGHSVAGA